MHFSAVTCIGNTLLGENRLTRATLSREIPKNALTRRLIIVYHTTTLPKPPEKLDRLVERAHIAIVAFSNLTRLAWTGPELSLV